MRLAVATSACERLEPRNLLAATILLAGRDILITGTTVNDVATVSLDNPSTMRVRVVSGAETAQQTFALGDVSRIVFNGGTGNDRFEFSTPISIPVSLVGGDGQDTLKGSSADDTITGGVGQDCLFGGDGTDLVIESASFGFDVFEFSLNLKSGTTIDERNHLDSIEEVDLTGGSGADSLNAANFPGRAILRGGGGNDTLVGTAAEDVLEGGDGADSILGGTGGDELFGGSGNDVLQGQHGDDTIDGGADADIVLGQQANDSLLGGTGRDVLIGSVGNDFLDGGDGDDLPLGGLYKFEGNFVALTRVRDDWNGASAYATRVTTLTAATHPYFLKSLVQPTDSATLFDDYQRDMLTGGTGQDFLLNPGDSSLTTADELTDRELTETVSASVYGTADPGFFPASMAKPDYLATLNDPNYGSPITRVTGNPGTELTLPLNSGGSVNTYWSGFYGTRYVTDSAWNIDGSKLLVKSNDPGQPYFLVLDGRTYQPLFQMDMTNKSPNLRWSQDPLQPDVQYGFFSPSFGDESTATSLPAAVTNDDKIIKYDATTGAVLNTITLPFNKLYSSKTAIAYVDGREYSAMLGVTKGLTRSTTNVSLFIVDLNPPVGASPVVASMNGIANVAGSVPTGYALDIANLWFAPNGQQVLVSYGLSDNARTWRLLNVNLSASTISPHVIPDLTADNAFQSQGNRLLGFMPVNWSHPAFAYNADASDVYIVGVSGQFNARSFPQNEVTTLAGRAGSVLAYQVGNDSFHSLTDPVDENLATHVTATNTLNPGQLFVTYFNDPARGNNFSGELVAIDLADPFGLGGTTHLAHHRTSIANGFYSGNTLPSASPDGSRIVFSSTWGPAQSVVQTYVLELSAPTPITNTFSVSALNAHRAEGTGGDTAFTFTVSRTGDTSGSATVNFAVNGISGTPAGAGDFGGSLPGETLNFAADETSKTLSINVTADSVGESDEEFRLTLSSPSSGAGITAATATGLIQNDDAILSLSVTNANRAEGDSGDTEFTFTVNRTGNTSGSGTVEFTVTGTGLNPADGTDFGGTLPTGTVNFGPGDVSQPITILVRGDTQSEADEGFTVTLSNSTAGTLFTASSQGRILNDDIIPVDLVYTAQGSSVLNVVVLPNGHLQVRIGAVIQPDVDPATVRSLRLNGGAAVDSINLTGLSNGLYTLLSSLAVKGGAGNDVITGSADFSETISGEAGNDNLNGGLGGNDRLVESALAGTTSPLTLTLTATRLTGGLGTDTLSNFDEALFTGGRGNDIFNAAAFAGAITLNGGEGLDVLTGGSANDSLDGGVGNDQLIGNGGDDVLNAGIGNDKLTGNLGNDQLLGGDGLDTVVGAGGLNYLLTDAALSGDGDDVLNSLEAASLSLLASSLVGGRIDVSGFAATGINTLIGSNADDVIVGGSGRDTIRGGIGNDVLTGGLGNDSMDGGTGTLDRIEESGDVDFKLTNSALTGLGADVITSNTVESARLTGGSSNNRLDASGFSFGVVTLNGGDGNDILQGGSKADSLIGGAGRDLLIGGAGVDTLGGDGDDDILIGGTIATSLNTATALNAIMAEWTSGGDVTTRQANLFNGGGLNGTTKLSKTTVLNDSGAADRLTGDAGTDWFFQYAADLALDFTAAPPADLKTV